MKSSTIADFLNKELIGNNIEIKSFSSLSKIQEYSVIFAKKYNKEYEGILKTAPNVLAIVCPGYEDITAPHILSSNPRLDFIRVVRHFFSKSEIPTGIHPSAVIESSAHIDCEVSIGAHCYIGSDVYIASGTVIMPNVSIYGKVKIGHNCYIEPGCVIGGQGFGFEYDEEGIPIQFPHTGEVIIGDNVYLGSNVTIDRATIDATIIEDNVKIDNLSHVAHNCVICANTLVTAGVMFCGGVRVGKKSWIAPNSSIHQQTKIGENCTVGMGAVVLTNVKDGRTVFGNPAMKVENF